MGFQDMKGLSMYAGFVNVMKGLLRYEGLVNI